MKKLISILIALGLLVNIAPTASAKPKGDWDSVKAVARESVPSRRRLAVRHITVCSTRWMVPASQFD